MSEPFQALAGLAEAWQPSSPGERLRRLRRAAAEAREELLSEGPVVACATCPLVSFPYPTLFAFSGAARSPAPFVMLTHRMQVVQLEVEGSLKTLLFNPSDVQRNKAAPYYANLIRRFGKLMAERVIPTYHGTVEGHLEALGLRPEDIDYLAYDHLHVQDVRRWLGGDGPAYFPRAKLLVHRREWQSARDLHPMSAVWYVPGGVEGVPEERVVQLEGDVRLGRGAALLSTPGHTLGNLSLALVTPKGLFAISENAVAAECYTPLQSRIPGVRSFAEQLGYEVVLNGNTREASLDQYSSMIVEKTLAGPAPDNPAFVNVFPSSQLTHSVLAPLLSPTYTPTPPECGIIRRPTDKAAA